MDIYAPQDVFVAKNEIDKFAAKHHLTYETLDCGMTLLAMPRLVEDVASSYITVKFPSGSSKDPKRIQGLHHLIEHLIANKPIEEGSRFNARFNAYTSYDEMAMTISATANPKVQDFGIWPALPLSYEALAGALSNTTEVEEHLSHERDVVKGEIAEDLVEHDRVAGRFFRSCVYADDNPLRIRTLGTPETLDAITPADITKYCPEIFVPDNAMMTIFNEGKAETSKLLVEKMKALFNDFPRKDKTATKLDRALLSRLHPDFAQGKVYSQDTKLENNLVTIFFTWVFPIEWYSVASFAMYRLLQRVDDKLFAYFRRKGLGYTSNVFKTGTDNLTICEMVLKIPKMANVVSRMEKEIYPEIREKVIAALDHEELAHINKKEQLIREAVPVSIASRFDFVVEGLWNYGQMIDYDKLDYSLITVKALEEMRDRLLEAPPAIVVAGDLE